ncbi:MAG: TerC family protein [Gammaproteobacteria bacterium]
MHSIGTVSLWAGFFTLVIAVLAMDIFLLGRKKAHRVTVREAACWTSVWIGCALIFNLVMYWYLYQTHGSAIAHQKSLEFLTGYLIEESLSFDNMFVILMIFKYFCVPDQYQRRVLLYGVLGAVILRFTMIFSGLWLVDQFHWLIYVFGAFLLFTGLKLFFVSEENKELGETHLSGWLQRHVRFTEKFHAEKFFVRKNQLLYATPLFLVLILVEFSDFIFAFDSIPAIFAITRDPFIVFTSNIFAILGLRSIYFLLANLAHHFHLLKYGIALVLVFIGGKMLAGYWFEIPTVLTLCVVAAILLTTIILSLLRKR